MNPSEYFDDLEAHEGCTTWLYCDVRGLVTVGIGNLVASPQACAELPFHLRDGLAATDEAKADAWARVHRAFDKHKSAAYYKAFSDMRLGVGYVRSLVAHRLETEFLPGIARLCPTFAEFPLPARRALVDMAYNLGVGVLGMFPHMLAACNEWDWAMAADQCHRSTCRESRNAWTATMFVDADATKGIAP